MTRRSLLMAILAVMPTVRAAAAPAPDAWKHAARYSFEYRVDLPRLNISEGQKLRIWAPYPAETADQKVLSVTIQSPWPYTLNRDAFGNQMIYLEGTSVPTSALTMRFVIERRPSDGVRVAAITSDTPLDPQRYLRSDRLIPLEGVIRETAAEQSRGLATPDEKVHAFYNYVVKTMRYNKEGSGWGRGDAVWACTNKRGNCTDFHSLFIGMARSQGIPARFMIGFPIPGDSDAGAIPGYHCWAEYYDQARGWVPVDASEANKSGWADAYFGSLPNDRIQFTVGRDLTLAPPQQGPPLNYFIYPYVEADGTAVDNLPAAFRFERLPVSSEL